MSHLFRLKDEPPEVCPVPKDHLSQTRSAVPYLRYFTSNSTKHPSTPPLTQTFSSAPFRFPFPMMKPSSLKIKNRGHCIEALPVQTTTWNLPPMNTSLVTS